MNCAVCRKRLTEQLEQESPVVLQRMAGREGLSVAAVLKQLNPLCRLCRMVFQQACEMHPAVPTTEVEQRLSMVIAQVLQSRAPVVRQAQESIPPGHSVPR
jgi:hypothetical protein